jgi:hypothetical protein
MKRMDATQLATQTEPCAGSLPELQVPMINSMVRCLESEHRKLDEHILQLALAATQLASDPTRDSAKARAVEAWDEIRRELWSHLQIEDELVFAWGDTHEAFSPTLVDTLRLERQAMRSLLATLPALPLGESCGLESTEHCITFARTLIALAQNLDSHVARYDTEVLPAILRAVFQK